MIQTNATDEFAALAARLTKHAQAIGSDWLTMRTSEQRSDVQRWRQPAYLWPRFARG